MKSEFVTLKSLARVITKGSTPTKQQGYTEEGINFISGSSINKNGQLDKDTFLKISEETHESFSRSIVENNDVLISIVGEIGRVAVATTEHLPANLNQQIAIIRPNKSIIYPRYLANLLRTYEIQHLLSSLSSGSVQDNLNLGDLRNLKIEKLQLDEQMSRNKLLELIEDKNIIDSKCSDISGTLISSLFRSWFIDFDPVKAKAEDELPYGMDKETAKLFPDSFEDSELGLIPAGWTIGTIHDIAKQRKDIARPEVFDDILPYIGLEHMPRNSIALTEWGVSEGLESNKFRYSKKDILFGKLRPYFHKVGPAPVEGVCSTDILVIQPIGEKSGGFLLPILSSEQFVNFVSGISEGVGLPRTKWEHFKLYKIALPPVEIREKFASFVDPMLQFIETSIHESKGLEHARDALLPRLMSGELKVN